MTFGGFILGVILMAVGFLAVWKTNWFLENLGDVGEMIGVYDKPWLSWKTLGVAFIFIGFMIAFGLFQVFFAAIFGRIFLFGG